MTVQWPALSSVPAWWHDPVPRAPRFGRRASLGGSRNMQRELSAEFIGTFTLVTAVCGAALFSAPSAGLVAVAFAVGLSVLAMAYAVGSISGGHFNPAVTCGLVVAGRFESSQAIQDIFGPGAGGLAGAGPFFIIPASAAGAGKKKDLFCGSHTPGGR